MELLVQRRQCWGLVLLTTWHSPCFGWRPIIFYLPNMPGEFRSGCLPFFTLHVPSLFVIMTYVIELIINTVSLISVYYLFQLLVNFNMFKAFRFLFFSNLQSLFVSQKKKTSVKCFIPYFSIATKLTSVAPIQAMMCEAKARPSTKSCVILST